MQSRIRPIAQSPNRPIAQSPNRPIAPPHPHPTPLDFRSHVTRWHQDPYAMGAYSFFARGMNLNHVLDIAKPEPAIRPPKASAPVAPPPPSSTPASDPSPVPEAEATAEPEPEPAAETASKWIPRHSQRAAVGLSDQTVPSPPPVPKPDFLSPPCGLTTPRLFFCGEHTTIRDAQVSRGLSTTHAIHCTA